MKVFILEDDWTRNAMFSEALGKKADLTIVNCMETAKKTFNPPYNLILLDHDLEGQVYVNSANPNTGAAFASWLASTFKPTEPVKIIVHSWNNVGGAIMTQILQGMSNVEVIRQEFGLRLLNTLKGWADESQ